MDAVEDDPAAHAEPADAPLTVELLADLQAGLLDEHDAARVRKRVRADPEAHKKLDALNQVRRDLSRLAAAPPPETPSNVVVRVGMALRSVVRPFTASSTRDRPAHAARPGNRPARTIAAVTGLGAAAAAVALGTAALVRAPAPPPSPPITAQHITVSPSARAILLSTAQILALLDRRPDYGPLNDPVRRVSCLGGLGYPSSTRVLGARPIQINGHPGILLILPGDTSGALAVLAVAPNCNAADTGLMADTEVARP